MASSASMLLWMEYTSYLAAELLHLMKREESNLKILPVDSNQAD